MTDGERDILHELEADARSLATDERNFDEIQDALAEMTFHFPPKPLAEAELDDMEREFADLHPEYPW